MPRVIKPSEIPIKPETEKGCTYRETGGMHPRRESDFRKQLNHPESQIYPRWDRNEHSNENIVDKELERNKAGIWR
jgi:hypothetical protein